MKKQDEISAELLAAGWKVFQPEDEKGWRYYFRLDPDPEAFVLQLGLPYQYCTVYPNGSTDNMISGTGYQRWTRERREREKILFRKFEGVI